MAGKRGAVVALDPRTGAILAMVSTPSYNPSNISTHSSANNTRWWNAYMHDPAQPMLNRAISQTYPPGSTFKIVDSIAGLQEGTLNTQTSYNCAGGIWFGGREYPGRGPTPSKISLFRGSATVLQALAAACLGRFDP